MKKIVFVLLIFITNLIADHWCCSLCIDGQDYVTWPYEIVRGPGPDEEYLAKQKIKKKFEKNSYFKKLLESGKADICDCKYYGGIF